MLHMHIHNDKTKSVLFGTFERFSLQSDDVRIELQEKCDISVSTSLERGLSFIEHVNRLKMKVGKRLGQYDQNSAVPN